MEAFLFFFIFAKSDKNIRFLTTLNHKTTVSHIENIEMENEKSYIDGLIADYLAQGLEKEKLTELKSWLEQSAENKIYFAQQREVWFSAVCKDESSIYNKEEAFKLFKNRVKDAVSKSVSNKNRSRLLPLFVRYAAVVVLLIAISGLAYWQGGLSVKEAFSDISIEAPWGSRTKLFLPDGTLVWLNAGSRMTYSQGFGVENRDIELEGEGYFEVSRNENLPFRVKTKELNLQVLGTKFNFRDYPEDCEVVVSLLEGKVGLNNLLRSEKNITLSPNERGVLDKSNGQMKVEKVDASNAVQWKDGYLFFDEELLSDISRKLERSYNVEITITNDVLKNYRFYGNFIRREQTVEEVLMVLTSLADEMKYKIEGKHITIY